ncbi:MAG TPA: hypothetical protein VNV17_18360 [Solirubrobacteraceae bacterium]|jgi:hypothetical protein|nr:hypothetical protein [Solirubrobacteraceae bacterium]
MSRARPSRTLAGVAVAVAAMAALLAGCGSSSGSSITAPTVAPAQTTHLNAFQPTGTVTPGKPVSMSFDIKLSTGKTLTQYKTGPGPHTGVHLIIVRDDLAYIIHQHPPIPPSGILHQSITFPAPGPYHVLVDVYPNVPGTLPNFQLSRSIRVAGAYHPRKLPPFAPHVVVDGTHFHMQPFAPLHAIQATFLHINVTDAQGRPVHFVPWFGALAHAIFFEKGTLNYFHTHVCAPDAPNCGSLAGAPKISGSSAAPGKLTIGVLLPVPGTWRLFVQLKIHGRVVTAPFTLDVH